MQQKLIVTDIDGTLLNSSKQLLPETQETIDLLFEKGHQFALATGRMHAAAKIVGSKLDYDGFLISCNGAVVKHLKTNEKIFEVPLEEDWIIRIVEKCRSYHAYFHLYNEEVIFAEERKHLSQMYADLMPSLPEQVRFEVRFSDDVLEDSKGYAIHKIGVFHEDPQIFQELIAYFEGLDAIDSCKSLDTSFDIMAKGVTKATGVAALSKHLRIPKECIIALGDNENDMAMLAYAGTGVAMGNAEDKVKKVADQVTGSNDETGWADAVTLFLEK